MASLPHSLRAVVDDDQTRTTRRLLGEGREIPSSWDDVIRIFMQHYMHEEPNGDMVTQPRYLIHILFLVGLQI